MTVEYLQEIVRLANEIYEKNDTVVLSDQVITTDRKCVDVVLRELTYEKYSRYLSGILSIIKELIGRSFPTEIYDKDLVSIEIPVLTAAAIFVMVESV